jgi:hypothetical protein
MTFGRPTKVFAVAEKFKPDPKGTRAKDTYMLTIFYESGDKVGGSLRRVGRRCE